MVKSFVGNPWQKAFNSNKDCDWLDQTCNSCTGIRAMCNDCAIARAKKRRDKEMVKVDRRKINRRIGNRRFIEGGRRVEKSSRDNSRRKGSFNRRGYFSCPTRNRHKTRRSSDRVKTEKINWIEEKGRGYRDEKKDTVASRE